MDEVINTWKHYLDNMKDWEAVIDGITPKETPCGPIYEPDSPLPERTETFAISDMREVTVALPHYHKNGETEIYFVVQGSGLTVVGGREFQLGKGSVVVTPPNTTHYTIPESNLVMMVINTPNFNPENIVEPTESDPDVKFNKDQYDKLVQRKQLT